MTKATTVSLAYEPAGRMNWLQPWAKLPRMAQPSTTTDAKPAMQPHMAPVWGQDTTRVAGECCEYQAKALDSVRTSLPHEKHTACWRRPAGRSPAS